MYVYIINRLAGTYSRDLYNFREIRTTIDRIQSDYRDDLPGMYVGR